MASPYIYHDYEEYGRASATPTPSPRGAYYYPTTPQRPATRAPGHYRNISAGLPAFSSSPGPSPRYTSDGHYATANVSGSQYFRKHSFSRPPLARPSTTTGARRASFAYDRASTPHGESDEEVFESGGITYVIPAQSKSSRSHKRGRSSSGTVYYVVVDDDGKAGADYYSREQGPAYGYEPQHAEEIRETEARIRSSTKTPRPTHSRRNSSTVPVRPQTARPGSSRKKAAPPPAPPPTIRPARTQATEEDAKKYKIPKGYSLKNWDPNEEPILLLGSVFDSDRLGKWIYDWTVHTYGPGQPITEMAGDFWLQLLDFVNRINHAEKTYDRVRQKKNKELLDEFIDSGDRIFAKLKDLMRACEKPMLKARSDKANGQLASKAGIIFVETLFGRDQVLDKTEKFIASLRTYNLRFDVNCAPILKAPES